jgi:hypothetical protein
VKEESGPTFIIIYIGSTGHVQAIGEVSGPTFFSYIYAVEGSTTDQIFCIRQILEKKWEFNETVHQIFVDFKKAYDSVRREVLYNILRVWDTHEIS